jgi:hypothetical protein
MEYDGITKQKSVENKPLRWVIMNYFISKFPHRTLKEEDLQLNLWRLSAVSQRG